MRTLDSAPAPRVPRPREWTPSTTPSKRRPAGWRASDPDARAVRKASRTFMLARYAKAPGLVTLFVRKGRRGAGGRGDCSVVVGAVRRGGDRALATRPKRYDVLAGIELAPAQRRLLLARESGSLAARFKLSPRIPIAPFLPRRPKQERSVVGLRITSVEGWRPGWVTGIWSTDSSRIRGMMVPVDALDRRRSVHALRLRQVDGLDVFRVRSGWHDRGRRRRASAHEDMGLQGPRTTTYPRRATSTSAAAGSRATASSYKRCRPALLSRE